MYRLIYAGLCQQFGGDMSTDEHDSLVKAIEHIALRGRSLENFKSSEYTLHILKSKWGVNTLIKSRMKNFGYSISSTSSTILRGSGEHQVGIARGNTPLAKNRALCELLKKSLPELLAMEARYNRRNSRNYESIEWKQPNILKYASMEIIFAVNTAKVDMPPILKFSNSGSFIPGNGGIIKDIAKFFNMSNYIKCDIKEKDYSGTFLEFSFKDDFKDQIEPVKIVKPLQSDIGLLTKRVETIKTEIKLNNSSIQFKRGEIEKINLEIDEMQLTNKQKQETLEKYEFVLNDLKSSGV